MSIEITLCARDAATEKQWLLELGQALSSSTDVRLTVFSPSTSSGQIFLIDQNHPQVGQVLESVEKKHRAIFLVTEDHSMVPALLEAGAVHDVLVHPFRSLEILGKIRNYRQILMWDEVSRLNASLSTVIEGLKEDLKLAERIQKARVVSRYADVKGFKIRSRYLAGVRPGGDHFDIAEPKEGGAISLVLSDSSSYGLSSAMLSVLMKVAVKLSPENAYSAKRTVDAIQDELRVTLGERDHLSLFYGVISRRPRVLRYLNLGGVAVFYSDPGCGFTFFPNHGGPLDRTSLGISASEQELKMEAEGRLVLLSDGFLEAFGGVDEVRKILDQFRDQDPQLMENELVYKIKSNLTTSQEEMPPQDCTVVTIEVEPNIVRFAKTH